MILLLLLYIPVSAINYLELELDILEVYQYVISFVQSSRTISSPSTYYCCTLYVHHMDENIRPAVL